MRTILKIPLSHLKDRLSLLSDGTLDVVHFKLLVENVIEAEIFKLPHCRLDIPRIFGRPYLNNVEWIIKETQLQRTLVIETKNWLLNEINVLFPTDKIGSLSSIVFDLDGWFVTIGFHYDNTRLQAGSLAFAL